MAGSRRVDLDQATTAAWRQYRAALADAIASMAGESLLVEAEWAEDDPTGGSPYVQFLSDEVTEEVYAEVSANRFLASRFRLDKVAKRRLADLGWHRPQRDEGHPNWWLHSDRVHADELAARTVQALRDVFGVLHPAFLRGLDVVGGHDVVVDADEPLAVTPRDLEHLRALVDEALTPVLGHAPSKDEDGDIPIIVGESVVFVQVLGQEPVVRIFVDLAVDVDEPARAEFEVGVLNRDHTFAKFSYTGNEIEATLHVPAQPFVPEHLRRAVHLVCGLTEQVVADLAVRVGGRQFLSEPGASPTGRLPGGRPAVARPAPPATLLALISLLDEVVEPPGRIAPREVVAACDDDPEILLDALRWAREAEADRRVALDRARWVAGVQRVSECEVALEHARRRRRLLSRALRWATRPPRPDGLPDLT